MALIGDRERESAVAQLHGHYLQGRLSLEELTDRLEVALGARRDGEVRRALATESIRLARRCYDTDESIGGSSAEEYAYFAVETWPDICRTPSWFAYQLRARQKAPRWLQVGSEQAHRVQHHLRWRLWRHYGI